MPKGITYFKMLKDKPCARCRSYRKREVMLFRISFDPDIINESMAEALPEYNNTTGVFCIFSSCDENFLNIHLNTKNLG